MTHRSFPGPPEFGGFGHPGHPESLLYEAIWLDTSCLVLVGLIRFDPGRPPDRLRLQ